jgi:uncharacterized RDD family membrane protein YckC
LGVDPILMLSVLYIGLFVCQHELSGFFAIFSLAYKVAQTPIRYLSFSRRLGWHDGAARTRTLTTTPLTLTLCGSSGTYDSFWRPIDLYL